MVPKRGKGGKQIGEERGHVFLPIQEIGAPVAKFVVYPFNRSRQELKARANGLSSRASELSSRANGLSGRAPELSGRAPELSGRAPELSGRAPELSSRAPELSSRAPELSRSRPRAPKVALPSSQGRAPELSRSRSRALKVALPVSQIGLPKPPKSRSWALPSRAPISRSPRLPFRAPGSSTAPSPLSTWAMLAILRAHLHHRQPPADSNTSLPLTPTISGTDSRPPSLPDSGYRPHPRNCVSVSTTPDNLSDRPPLTRSSVSLVPPSWGLRCYHSAPELCRSYAVVMRKLLASHPV
ncbi:hypothetical protein C8Q76DRAFT_698613 [Earliella scabrosa]|nr:hypothetical protein C8Q76DRAFT_698613 [Earliella scabrosa]